MPIVSLHGVGVSGVVVAGVIHWEGLVGLRVGVERWVGVFDWC